MHKVYGSTGNFSFNAVFMIGGLYFAGQLHRVLEDDKPKCYVQPFVCMGMYVGVFEDDFILWNDNENLYFDPNNPIGIDLTDIIEPIQGIEQMSESLKTEVHWGDYLL